ncbi:MAG: biopolymer transporter ExbD, partial [Planctomycetaceae bacterium]
MRIPSHTGRTDISENMMTPMIDVVFNLISVVRVGTQFTDAERQIGLQVPRVIDRGTLSAAPER